MKKLTVTIDNHAFDVEVAPKHNAPGEFELIVDGQPLHVYVPDFDKPEYADWMLIDNRPYELNIGQDFRSVQIYSGRYAVQVRDQEIPSVRLESGDGRVKAPIPGLITRILVEEGNVVEAGQSLLILEAMKMENEVRAPRSGIVREVAVLSAQSVKLGEFLLEIE